MFFIWRSGFLLPFYAYAVADKDALVNNPVLYLNDPVVSSMLDSIDDEDRVLLKFRFK